MRVGRKPGKRIAWFARTLVVPLLVLGLASARAESKDGRDPREVDSSADSDSDGVPDALDNCLEMANPSQRNRDFDRFGDVCDGDVDQNEKTDAADRKLVAGEVKAPRPRLLVDFDGDGRVGPADLLVFDERLVGKPPGPAGARANDSDGEASLDACAPLDLEREQAGTLPNGGFDANTKGWKVNRPYVAFARDEGHRSAGALQWLTWGGAGHSSGDRCGGSCVQPGRLPVEAERTYAYSFFTCVPTYPPATLALAFAEYDVGGRFLGMLEPLNSSRFLNSQPEIWEENVGFYRPSSTAVVFAQPKLFRKAGPTLARGPIFADDFSFRGLEAGERRSRDMSPSPKRPFVGQRTSVDELGNVRVRKDGAWRDVIPFGIYVNAAQDYRVYVDAGFDVAMNERGYGAEAAPAIDARSGLVPDGMWFMFVASRWGHTSPGNLSLETALQNLKTKTSPQRGIRLWDRLLAFNYDNEIFTRCAVRAKVGRECLVSMWEAERKTLARIFEVDREENAGSRGVPTYFLNGNVGVARAFAGEASAVDDLGSVRSDTTGSYGASSIYDLQVAQNQLAPPLIVQVQSHMGDRFRPIAFGGLALGAKMIGVWRDWPPSAGTYGRVRVAPELSLCGPTTIALRARERRQNPTGQVVQGAQSGARAEILDSRGAFEGCRPTETGLTLRVHLRRGAFAPGESLIDAQSGAPLPGIRIANFRGDPLVDYEVSITERGWYKEMPGFRREIDALAPILRASHRTDWRARVLASARGGGAAPFGDSGIIWGTRNHDGAAYLLLANTFHQLDTRRDWDEQFVGRALDLEIELEGLPVSVRRARRFDRQALEFSDDDSIDVRDGRLTLSLPPFATTVLEFRLDAGGM